MEDIDIVEFSCSQIINSPIELIETAKSIKDLISRINGSENDLCET